MRSTFKTMTVQAHELANISRRIVAMGKRSNTFLWDHRARLALLISLAAVVYVVKDFYSGASAAELGWILAPTATLVGWIHGTEFVFESGEGWVSRSELFAIAPECAGINFLLAALLTVSVVIAWRKNDISGVAGSVILAAVVAYVATVLINAVRILIALELRESGALSGLFEPTQLHRIEGIAVYFTGLWLLYRATASIANREAASA